MKSPSLSMGTVKGDEAWRPLLPPLGGGDRHTAVRGLVCGSRYLGGWRARGAGSQGTGIWELVLGGLVFRGLVLGMGVLVLRVGGSWCSVGLVLGRGAGAQVLVLGRGAGARGAGVPGTHVCLFSSIQVSKPHHPNYQG